MAFRIANDRGVDICNRSLVHHSDRGVQYASKKYVEMLRSARVSISMTECGDPKENAIAERKIQRLKMKSWTKEDLKALSLDGRWLSPFRSTTIVVRT